MGAGRDGHLELDVEEVDDRRGGVPLLLQGVRAVLGVGAIFEGLEAVAAAGGGGDPVGVGEVGEAGREVEVLVVDAGLHGARGHDEGAGGADGVEAAGAEDEGALAGARGPVLAVAEAGEDAEGGRIVAVGEVATFEGDGVVAVPALALEVAVELDRVEGVVVAGGVAGLDDGGLAAGAGVEATVGAAAELAAAVGLVAAAVVVAEAAVALLAGVDDAVAAQLGGVAGGAGGARVGLAGGAAGVGAVAAAGVRGGAAAVRGGDLGGLGAGVEGDVGGGFGLVEDTGPAGQRQQQGRPDRSHAESPQVPLVIQRARSRGQVGMYIDRCAAHITRVGAQLTRVGAGEAPARRCRAATEVVDDRWRPASGASGRTG